MIKDVSDNIPRFDEYGVLFKSEERVQSTLVKIYSDVLEFCIAARDVFAVQQTSARKCKNPRIDLGDWLTFQRATTRLSGSCYQGIVEEL